MFGISLWGKPSTHAGGMARKGADSITTSCGLVFLLFLLHLFRPLGVLLRLVVRLLVVPRVFVARHDLHRQARGVHLLHVVGVLHRFLQHIGELLDDRRRDALRARDAASRARDHG